MEHRRPRLGGIVDDYCPRERRITDHAVVAMVEDEIKQTRCTTCDDEHPYKKAKVPAARKKKSTLYQQVLAGKADSDAASPSPVAKGNGQLAGGAPAGPGAAEAAGEAASDDAERVEADEIGVHRQLIRATLPRTESHVQARPLPEFTIRQNASLDGQYGEADSRRPPRGGMDGQPGNRRGGDGSRPRRPGRGSIGRAQSASANVPDSPNGHPKSRSRRSRHSSRHKKRSR